MPTPKIYSDRRGFIETKRGFLSCYQWKQERFMKKLFVIVLEMSSIDKLASKLAAIERILEATKKSSPKKLTQFCGFARLSFIVHLMMPRNITQMVIIITAYITRIIIEQSFFPCVLFSSSLHCSVVLQSLA